MPKNKRFVETFTIIKVIPNKEVESVKYATRQNRKNK